MSEPDELITVGKILKPFGVGGEVRVQSLTDVPGRLEGLDDVILETHSGELISTKVSHVRVDKRSYLLKFSAFSTPEEARRFQHAWLKIPKQQMPPLPPGEHYQFELIGLTVEDKAGHRLGTLEEVLELPAQHVFVVRNGSEEMWIPATQKMVIKVDLKDGVMVVESRYGLVTEHDAL